jgi:hypothetical protein
MAKPGITEPWERQPRESDEAWQAFKTYRDWQDTEGTLRSYAKVAAKLGKSTTLMERWAKRWNWQERVRLHTNSLEEVARLETIKEIKAFRKRAARQLMAKAQTLMLPDIALSKVLASGMTVEEVLSKFTPGQLVKLAVEAAKALPNVVKAEALALGDVTERHEEDAPPLEELDPLTEAIASNPDLLAKAAQIVEAAGGES